MRNTSSKRLALALAVFPVLALLFLPVTRHSRQLHAQGVAYWCTNVEVTVRSCPRWHDCDALFTYSPSTLLFVVGMKTGDREAGTDQWLRIEDPVMGQQGYVHSTQAHQCDPAPWQTRPVVPVVSETAREIYRRGLELGNNPRAFSKVGDCQNVEAYFLSNFDEPGQYDLGPYSALQAAIDNFRGSFSRQSAAVQGGFTVASVLSPLMSDPAFCQSDESPLECEERLQNPSLVIISMETWNRRGKQPVSLYEDYLSQIVQFWIGRGVVPILATKADNLEGDGSINAAIVRVAERYDVPLWNFWLAAQSLPGHGFDPAWNDGFHLLWARSFYNNPARLRDGWPIRNLTALQALDAVWRGVTAP
jgi:hypothetical protein